MWQLSNSWPNQFQNNLTWPSNTAGISLDSRLEYSKISHRYAKVSIHLVLVLKTSHWYRFHTLYLSFSPGCEFNARLFWWTSCTSARHAGSFHCLMTSLILITMDNGRGHCAYWQSCKVPNQTHRGMQNIRKMYVIKQIKICAEYRDMLPRARLDLSGTPGLRPIGLSPGSWQTSLGLGSMSRFSAQILICITHMLIFRIGRNDKGNTCADLQDRSKMIKGTLVLIFRICRTCLKEHICWSSG